MAQERNRRARLAQNFLRSPALARRLVQASSIDESDLVYEIGPGSGILTAELAKIARRVVAVEADPKLAHDLEKRFRHNRHVAVVHGDFLQYRIRAEVFKIFSNLPFNLTSAMVRKILGLAHPPREASLVMQQEAAHRLIGRPHETQLSVLTKPDWSLQIVHRFLRSDFEPVPSVNACLLRLQRRTRPLVARRDRALFRRFIRYGHSGRKATLKLVFKPLFTHTQWKRISSELRIPRGSRPSDLSFQQWLDLFRRFEELVPAVRQGRIWI